MKQKTNLIFFFHSWLSAVGLVSSYVYFRCWMLVCLKLISQFNIVFRHAADVSSSKVSELDFTVKIIRNDCVVEWKWELILFVLLFLCHVDPHVYGRCTSSPSSCRRLCISRGQRYNPGHFTALSCTLVIVPLTRF